MGRRRTRAATTVTAKYAIQTDCKEHALQSEAFNELVHLANDSPKRKDLKIDKISEKAAAATEATKSHIKTRSERNAAAARNVGVPLATRYQTKTIENFFKAKNAKQQTAEHADILTGDAEQCCMISTVQVPEAVDLHAYRTAHDNSASSTDSAAANNSFGEDSLSPSKDCKATQQTGKVIFSTASSSISAAMLHGRFQTAVTLGANSPTKSSNRIASSPEKKEIFALPSCVATATPDPPMTRRRKPTTPHRIMCSSPIKSTAFTTKSSQRSKALLRRRLQQQLSPTGNNDNDEEFENLSANAAVASIIASNSSSNAMKSVLNSAKYPTAQQNSTNNKPASSSSDDAKQVNKPKLSNFEPLPHGNRELTEFFPVRRSVRKTKSAVKEETMQKLEQAILQECCDGLIVQEFEDKGRGVVTARHFKRGDFVIEYIGDLITVAEAAKREKRYALDANTGCYMYYFKHKNQQYCIDATFDNGKLGRLVNHSRNGNLTTKVVVIKQLPHLVLIAKDDIEPGVELTYDYGDRSKQSLLHHPWLAF